MFSKYLNYEDKTEYKKQCELARGHEFADEAIRAMTAAWFRKRFKKYRLDPNKHYSIHSESGQIKEIKPKKDD